MVLDEFSRFFVFFVNVNISVKYICKRPNDFFDGFDLKVVKLGSGKCHNA
jgi:hypothetical protein